VREESEAVAEVVENSEIFLEKEEKIKKTVVAEVDLVVEAAGVVTINRYYC
jgi:hypothetical protein